MTAARFLLLTEESDLVTSFSPLPLLFYYHRDGPTAAAALDDTEILQTPAVENTHTARKGHQIEPFEEHWSASHLETSTSKC